MQRVDGSAQVPYPGAHQFGIFFMNIPGRPIPGRPFYLEVSSSEVHQLPMERLPQGGCAVLHFSKVYLREAR